MCFIQEYAQCHSGANGQPRDLWPWSRRIRVGTMAGAKLASQLRNAVRQRAQRSQGTAQRLFRLCRDAEVESLATEMHELGYVLGS